MSFNQKMAKINTLRRSAVYSKIKNPDQKAQLDGLIDAKIEELKEKSRQETGRMKKEANRQLDLAKKQFAQKKMQIKREKEIRSRSTSPASPERPESPERSTSPIWNRLFGK